MLLKAVKPIALFPYKLITNSFMKKTYPVARGLCLLNLIVQKVFRINAHVPFMVHYTSRVTGDIQIGKNVWISFAISGGCYIQGLSGIIIGDDTIFAPGVKIISANHDKQNHSKIIHTNPIKIGKKCWIGTNAIILPDVELGDNVIVGAGSVVNKSFPQDSVIAGNPAKRIN